MFASVDNSSIKVSFFKISPKNFIETPNIWPLDEGSGHELACLAANGGEREWQAREHSGGKMRARFV